MSTEHGLDPWDRITSHESKRRLVCLRDNIETGLKLIRAFKPVPDHSLIRWRLEIPSDSKDEELTLTWEYGLLAPDRLLRLQRIDDERCNGCPFDMKITQQLNRISGKLKFETAYERQQPRNLPLQSGWDAIDSQRLNMQTLGELPSMTNSCPERR